MNIIHHSTAGQLGHLRSADEVLPGKQEEVGSFIWRTFACTPSSALPPTASSCTEAELLLLVTFKAKATALYCAGCQWGLQLRLLGRQGTW